MYYPCSENKGADLRNAHCCFSAPVYALHDLSHLMRKPTMWFPNWSDTNRAMQAKKIARSLRFFNKRNGTIHVAKAKALISGAITAQLICAFVFTY